MLLLHEAIVLRGREMADQGAEGLLSPYLRRKRFEAIMPYLKGRVLDFGCGSGNLAAYVDSDKYYGVDIDTGSLQQAALRYPEHHFISELPNSDIKFDSIVSLAVIEHVSSPVQFLHTLALYLDKNSASRIVITTPHPTVGWVHDLGAAIGLFSRHANEEHEELLDRGRLDLTGKKASLKLTFYRRFLFGANQIAVFEKNYTTK